MNAQHFFQSWNELEKLQHDVHNLFNWSAPRGVAVRSSAEVLPINVFVGEEGAVLRAALAGVDASSLDLSVLGETLTVRGRRHSSGIAELGGVTAHRRERTVGEFARTVQLPFRVDAEKVVAQYHRGVLELTLPRAAADKPQRIAIKAA